jgi:hypothetical protein
MEARAEFINWSSTRALVVLMVAVVAALLVGGAGGYMVRALTYSASTSVTDTTRPFVVEPAPYSSPARTPAALPTRDPKGFEVPI